MNLIKLKKTIFVLISLTLCLQSCSLYKTSDIETLPVDSTNTTNTTNTSSTTNTTWPPSSPSPTSTALTIIIDPGHGGKDHGATGVIEGALPLIEKEYALQIAKTLRDKLKAKNINALLTREDNTFVSLKKRTTLANEKNAKLFVSIHGNAAAKNAKDAHGVHIYYLDNSNDAASLKLAERENLVFENEAKEIDALSFMISDLIQSTKIKDSILLAEKIEKSLQQRFKPEFTTTKLYGIEKAPFYVLTGTFMPSVLLELFFIDSTIDRKIIEDTKFFDKITESIAQGITEHLS